MNPEPSQLSVNLSAILLRACNVVDRHWRDGESTAAEVYLRLLPRFQHRHDEIANEESWIAFAATREANRLHAIHRKRRQKENLVIVRDAELSLEHRRGRQLQDFHRVHTSQHSRFLPPNIPGDVPHLDELARREFSTLPPIDRQIIGARCHLPGCPSVRELALKLGITRARIYQRAIEISRRLARRISQEVSQEVSL